MTGSAQSAATEEGHRQPPYVAIWLALVVLLAVSVGTGMLGHRLLATVSIFVIAIVKAGLVLANFMHMRFEPRWVAVAIAGAIVCVIVLFIGLYPDIVGVARG